ncbi:hypothetical protein SDC9_124033 [bioreactor metagenome]|uniref:Uncharacterized protein n=1 Tax=bioreactor metagenome TaxID=1076179 RepID=A0A645CJB6_9ZZZZ
MRFRRNNFSLVFFLQIIQITDNIQLLFRPQHQIHTVDGGNFIGFELGVTTGNHYKCAGMALDHSPNGLTPFLVGQFRNGTGIYDTNISLLPFPGTQYSGMKQLLADSRRFRKIQFATQCIICSRFIFKNSLIDHE